MEIILGQEYKNEKEDIGNKFDDFEILQTLGKGSYGFVAKVRSKINQKIYAMKMIDFSLIKDQSERQLTQNEIKIIKSSNSPHIIKCYNYFTNGDKCYLLMEYMNNGDLKGFITAHQSMKTPVDQKELLQIFYQCMSGLSYIHQKNLIHRDIKPANIFLTDNKVIKIGDFGVSAIRKINQNNNLTNQSKIQKENIMIGTPLYMSPEIFNQEQYGSKVDVYSMGCTFYELCYFTPPRIPKPTPKNINGQFALITEFQDVTQKENENFYSPEIKQIINEMIEKDQKVRPSTGKAFDSIKRLYNSQFHQNSSIFCVYRCLSNYLNFVNHIKKYSQNLNESTPISKTFFFAYSNLNNLNNNNILQPIRDIIIYENPCFFDPGEIEPSDLIDFLLKKLHLENNHVKNNYSRLFCMDNDRDIFDRQNILKKYMITFSNNFKSFISSNFFGHFEIIKNCLNCKKMRYYFESFFYLTIDISQAINNGLNPLDQNFIIQCYQVQISKNINKMDFCPFCNKAIHLENKKILAFPINLIICIKYQQDKMNNQNIYYPIYLSNLGNIPASFKLTGLIKRYIVNEEKFFVSIYEDSNNWVINDGYQSQLLATPFAHTQGQVIMLFYNLNNVK